jgi:hypothetical protein
LLFDNQALLSEENTGLIKVSSYSLMIPNIGCIFSSRDKGYSIFTKENSSKTKKEQSNASTFVGRVTSTDENLVIDGFDSLLILTKNQVSFFSCKHVTGLNRIKTSLNLFEERR